MAKVQFDLVSPERKLASLEVEQVQIPGSEGRLTAMAGHEPTILTLRPGRLIVSSSEGEQEYIVTGGFAELSPEHISVLAEVALPRGEMSQEIVTDLIAKARAEHDKASQEDQAETHSFLADVMHIAEDLGFHTNL
ncbi:ATP synthase F1 subunit epsilon [Celeribacter halophilus]|jgi:F-type H+-transporting ATPase subunit epsilon|uniref:ATP synthase epsilon chain n=1 Tax=Celeribacter halophilus TaxID=576117 RepID=A0A1I3S550_9RHOB|nr:ATP synthase F1 subunit epsilon [Celeribacter halophilus]MBU2890199.1 ATP synthase F1 subunit epsilon [Celeribacter halophilus]MDO6457191.1 ATP synthase F1 subunit epsilon [Celeribacter halophilus]MDO6509908.1 ATP synthase F1 subunit epsilon [Celeribacter halophilus]MDO6723719.1 ATP synthase F1 subunit epsilon [Celeribacter halophilus]PZX11484.1 F-type H+-transporting ATPase subunit epsilon [Celeribacter halophilus]